MERSERVKGTRIYERIVDSIKSSIAKGEIAYGDPLQSERRMMDDMGVSRSSLREAFRVLELLGLIESIPGKGRFVRRPKVAASGDSRVLALENSAILELMEARRVLDPAIASEAARRATSQDVAKMRRILTGTREGLDDIERRAQHDYDFHLAMAEATHNFIFVNVVRMEFNLIMATHEQIYGLLDDKEKFLHEHERLYEEIIDHNIEAAGVAAAQHIERIYKTLLGALAEQYA